MNTPRQSLKILLVVVLPALAVFSTGQAQPPYGAPPGYGGPPGYGPPPGYDPRYPGRRTAGQAQSAAASVTINEPQDGAEVASGKPVTLKYQVVPGPQGDHVHVYVNGTEVAILRELTGSYTVGVLPAGRNELAIKVVNRAHVPIGVESSVTVNVH